MPHFDKDPHNPTDVIGRPIAEGDFIAYPTMWGSSAQIRIARIEKIRFKKNKIKFDYQGKPYESKYDFEDCPRHQAVKYTLYVQPIEKKDGRWTDRNYRDEPNKCVTLQKVGNAVRVDPVDLARP